MNHLKHITAPEFFNTYLRQVRDKDLFKALSRNTKELKRALASVPKDKWDYTYAEGKWSVLQVLQHLIDAERVFLFRALWFARMDPQPLPGFEENEWAVNAVVAHRRPKELIREMMTLRKSTIQFFQSLPKEALRQTGTANQHQISVAALGFICVGHVSHHLEILRTRYLDSWPGSTE